MGWNHQLANIPLENWLGFQFLRFPPRFQPAESIPGSFIHFPHRTEAPGRGAGIAAPRAMKPPVEGHDFAVFRRRGSTAVEVKGAAKYQRGGRQRR